MKPEESTLHYGLRIEQEARLWLENRYPGLRFIQANYRWKGGELDLIFEDHSRVTKKVSPELLFVEVRARSKGAWISGLESVTHPKQRRLARTIRHFLIQYHGPCQSLRLDIMSWDDTQFEHFQGIRLPDV